MTSEDRGQPQHGEPPQYPQYDPNYAPQPPQYGQPQYGQPYVPPPYYGQPQYGQPYVPPPYPGAPAPQGWAPEPPPPRRRGKRLAAAAGAAVVVAGAAVAVVTLTGGDSDGKSGVGAASPQAVATELQDAITTMDFDKLITIMDPGEIKGMRALSDASKAQARKLNLPATNVPGAMSVKITGLTTQVTQPADDVAFVSVTGGRYTVTIDPDKMSIPGVSPASGQGPQTEFGDLQLPVPLAVVKVGGKWYFSPTTTALEAARQQGGLDEPNWKTPTTLKGGDSPEGAITGLLDGFKAQDFKAMAGFVAAEEVPALRYYFSILPAPPSDPSGHMEYSDLQTHTEAMTDGLTKVYLDGIKLAEVGNARPQQVALNGSCVQVNGKQQCLPPIFKTALGSDKAFVVVSKSSAGWQINPIATYLEYLRSVLAEGDLWALMRLTDVEVVAPITATLSESKQAQVKLNTGGFAHVKVVGTPNACLEADGADVYLQPAAGPFASPDFGSSCGGLELDDSGQGQGVLVTADPASGAQTVSVTLTAR